MSETTQPGHTVTTEETTAKVVVRSAAGDHVIAESEATHVLRESNIKDRWYFPREDVSANLIASEKTSHCPFKGDASYWNVQLDDGTVLADAAWSYEQPLSLAAEVQSEISFWGSMVHVQVDGEQVSH